MKSKDMRVGQQVVANDKMPEIYVRPGATGVIVAINPPEMIGDGAVVQFQTGDFNKGRCKAHYDNGCWWSHSKTLSPVEEEKASD